MHNIKVKLSFERLPVPELIGFSGKVSSSIDKNPLFPDPDVLPADIKTASSILLAKYESALNRGKIEIAEMHSAKSILLNLLHEEAEYVNKIADGDKEIILKSGFEPTKEPSPALRPEFSVILGGEPGQVLLMHKAVKGAAAYLWQFAPDPLPTEEKLWLLAGVSTQAKCVIENLDSGTKYWFRVAAVTTKGMLPHSIAIPKIIS